MHSPFFLESLLRWSYRPVTATISDAALGPTLPVSCEDIRVDEVVVNAALNFNHGKSAGHCSFQAKGS